MREALCSLKLRRVCLFPTLPKQRVSFTPNRERVTGLEKLQPKQLYAAVSSGSLFVCECLYALFPETLCIQKSSCKLR